MTITDRIGGLSASVAIKAPCRVATSANIALSALQTIDGVVLAAGDRVLVKDQDTASENGIYTADTSAWRRAKDFDGGKDIVDGTLLYVRTGSAAGGTFWRVDASDDPLAIGTSSITFAQANSQLAGVSPFMATVLNDTNAAAARTTLGAGSSEAATTSASGLVELATSAETQTGSDTTRAVTPAGAAATYRKQGRETVWVPAPAMRPASTNGCAPLATVETTAGRPDLNVLDFDAATEESAMFSIRMPKSWNRGTVTFAVYWTSSATDNDGVAWGLRGVACSDGDTLDVAFGSGVTVGDLNQSTSEDLYITDESPPVTIGGMPGIGDLCFFEAYRDVMDANDTADEDARLIGIAIFITTSAGDDS